MSALKRGIKNGTARSNNRTKTKETDISLTINLDGTGENEIATGIPFFDHMLNGFARHGLFDLKVHVTGDLEVDSHHTIEDTGIVLGQAIAAALGEKKGSSVTEAFCFLWTRHSPCVQ
jgi:Imidazoleglycerol-phosphate dehydratase